MRPHEIRSEPNVENIRGMQYYQDTPGKIDVRIIPDDGFTDHDVKRITSELRIRLAELITNPRNRYFSRAFVNRRRR